MFGKLYFDYTRKLLFYDFPTSCQCKSYKRKKLLLLVSNLHVKSIPSVHFYQYCNTKPCKADTTSFIDSFD